MSAFDNIKNDYSTDSYNEEYINHYDEVLFEKPKDVLFFSIGLKMSVQKIDNTTY